MAKKKKKRQAGASASKTAAQKPEPRVIKPAPPKPNKPLLLVTGGLFFLFLAYLFVIAVLVQFG